MSTTRSHGGTGLGLTICKRICDLMDGRIQVESKRVEGRAFVVRGAGADARAVIDGQYLMWQANFDCWLRAERGARLGGDDQRAGGRAEHLGDTKAATLKARPSDVLAIAGIIDGGLGTAALAAMRRAFRGTRRRQPRQPSACHHHLDDPPTTMDGGPGRDRARPAVVMPLPHHFARSLGALTASAQDGNAAPMGTTNALTFAPPSLRQARAQGAVVLVAEDNEINRLVIQGLLHRLGFAAEMAINGSAAMALLRRRPFGLVLADIHMPVMDGLKLAKEIRRMGLRKAAGQPVPIVALTADVLVSTEAVTRQAGRDAYLRKPISVEGLRDVLAEFMPQALPLRISNRAWTTRPNRRVARNSTPTVRSRTTFSLASPRKPWRPGNSPPPLTSWKPTRRDFSTVIWPRLETG